jgi:hypothetical protein
MTRSKQIATRIYTMSRFIQVSRQQQYLLPPSIDEWLPENYLARFIGEAIEHLDLSRLTRRYSERGSAAHRPAELLVFRFLSADTHPDHDTLANFRKTFLVEPEDLFVQVRC